MQEIFSISEGIDGSVRYYNVTFVHTDTGIICGFSRTLLLQCQNGFCTDSVLIPSLCDGRAVSIMMSATNRLGSGPFSKPFDLSGMYSTVTHGVLITVL